MQVAFRPDPPLGGMPTGGHARASPPGRIEWGVGVAAERGSEREHLRPVLGRLHDVQRRLVVTEVRVATAHPNARACAPRSSGHGGQRLVAHQALDQGQRSLGSVGRHQVPRTVDRREAQPRGVAQHVAHRLPGRGPGATSLCDGSADLGGPDLGTRRRHTGVAEAVVDEDPEPLLQQLLVRADHVGHRDVVAGHHAVPLLPRPRLRPGRVGDDAQGALHLRAGQVLLEGAGAAAGEGLALAPVPLLGRPAGTGVVVDVVLPELQPHRLQGTAACRGQLLRALRARAELRAAGPAGGGELVRVDTRRPPLEVADERLEAVAAAGAGHAEADATVADTNAPKGHLLARTGGSLVVLQYLLGEQRHVDACVRLANDVQIPLQLRRVLVEESDQHCQIRFRGRDVIPDVAIQTRNTAAEADTCWLLPRQQRPSGVPAKRI
mmetsp:Transcript_101767/g.273371  ORF Transcript_101767/g.273371 Transcript_101767/m.273371 type:complete len:437 (+) Transcript_101767:1-1311(+)